MGHLKLYSKLWKVKDLYSDGIGSYGINVHFDIKSITKACEQIFAKLEL